MCEWQEAVRKSRFSTTMINKFFHIFRISLERTGKKLHKISNKNSLTNIQFVFAIRSDNEIRWISWPRNSYLFYITSTTVKIFFCFLPTHIIVLRRNEYYRLTNIDGNPRAVMKVTPDQSWNSSSVLSIQFIFIWKLKKFIFLLSFFVFEFSA